MRILLVQNFPYFPSYAGGSRSDRLMIAALARRGHDCRVVARINDSSPGARAKYLCELNERGVVPEQVQADVITFFLDLTEVHIATADIRACAAEQLTVFRPDLVLISTDPLNVLISDFTRTKAAKLVYLARTTTLLPFGPDSAFPSKTKTDAIRRADAVIAVSHYLADYILEYSGIPAIQVPIDLMDANVWPTLGHLDNPFVTMVNPCALKGISIFLGLADAFPSVAFAAVPTWGTTSADRAELATRPNVHLLTPVDDIRDIFRRTRVTLVPSLWSEAWGRIVVESMLSGVPVIASDQAGLREAAMGVAVLIPVTPITKYKHGVDEHMIRAPEVPPQNLTPWCEALSRLLTFRDYYAQMSQRSREAALRYVDGSRIDLLEYFLDNLTSGSVSL